MYPTKPLADRDLRCIDCGLAFTFSVGEQAYLAHKGLAEPRRCEACRPSRRQTTAGPRRASAKKGHLHFFATCSECGRDVRLPFQPRSDKPVYCTDCLRARRVTRLATSYSAGSSRNLYRE